MAHHARGYVHGRVFGVEIRDDIVHRVVQWQLANSRTKVFKTKTISEVRGGGRKPWAQKHTGRARTGSIRCVAVFGVAAAAAAVFDTWCVVCSGSQWRGGAKPHGPKIRDYSQKLNKKSESLVFAGVPRLRSLARRAIQFARWDCALLCPPSSAIGDLFWLMSWLLRWGRAFTSLLCVAEARQTLAHAMLCSFAVLQDWRLCGDLDVPRLGLEPCVVHGQYVWCTVDLQGKQLAAPLVRFLTGWRGCVVCVAAEFSSEFIFASRNVKKVTPLLAEVRGKPFCLRCWIDTGT